MGLELESFFPLVRSYLENPLESQSQLCWHLQLQALTISIPTSHLHVRGIVTSLPASPLGLPKISVMTTHAVITAVQAHHGIKQFKTILKGELRFHSPKPTTDVDAPVLSSARRDACGVPINIDEDQRWLGHLQNCILGPISAEYNNHDRFEIRSEGIWMGTSSELSWNFNSHSQELRAISVSCEGNGFLEIRKEMKILHAQLPFQSARRGKVKWLST
jgi:hypothetical protein